MAQNNLAEAEAELADMQAGPDESDIQQKEQQLIVAQNNLAEAEAELADMQAGPDELTIEQKQQLLIIAQSNLTQAQATLDELSAEPDSLDIQLKQLEVENAQAAVTLAEKQAQYNALVAPSAGTITTVNIEAGDSVAAATVAIELVDTGLFELSASVNELDIPQVQVGQTAIVTVGRHKRPDLYRPGGQHRQ